MGRVRTKTRTESAILLYRVGNHGYNVILIKAHTHSYAHCPIVHDEHKSRPVDIQIEEL